MLIGIHTAAIKRSQASLGWWVTGCRPNPLYKELRWMNEQEEGSITLTHDTHPYED